MEHSSKKPKKRKTSEQIYEDAKQREIKFML